MQRELERDEDDPDTQLFYLTMETMYREHPVRFPIIGYKPIVQSLKKEDIVGYYHRMYVPDNILVCIVGDIDLDRHAGRGPGAVRGLRAETRADDRAARPSRR